MGGDPDGSRSRELRHLVLAARLSVPFAIALGAVMGAVAFVGAHDQVGCLMYVHITWVEYVLGLAGASCLVSAVLIGAALRRREWLLPIGLAVATAGTLSGLLGMGVVWFDANRFGGPVIAERLPLLGIAGSVPFACLVAFAWWQYRRVHGPPQPTG